MRTILQCGHIILFFCILFLSGRIESYGEGKRQENLPDIHIVEEGDNLWELSKKYLNDPFKWRNLWKENSYIDDPKFIFPGDPIRFPGRSISYPVSKKKSSLAKIKKEVQLSPPLMPKLLPVASITTLTSAGFIIQTDNPQGQVIASLDEKLIMGKGDLVYIDIGKKKDVTKGKKYTIYGVNKRVVHPVTGRKYGYLINILGELEVEKTQKNISLAVIVQSYKEIEAGNRLMAYESLVVPTITPEGEKEKKDIQGYILAAKEEKKWLGEEDIVYIDSGVDQGVFPGDEFVAFRFRGEEAVGHLVGKKETLPKIVIGNLRVISVREKTAAAIITDSKQELTVGEKIEYRN